MTLLSDPGVTGRPANVWLASYPKSGNTWFRLVWDAVLAGSDQALDADSIVTPGSTSGEQPCQMEYLRTWGIDARRLTADELDLVRARVEVMDGDRNGRPRLRKTHERFRYAPDGSELFPAVASRAALILVRDPRDVACSAARHYDLDLDGAVAMLCQRDAAGPGFPSALMSRQPMGSWSEHLDSWLRQAAFPVATFRYEDLLAEPVAMFHRALTFAGLAVSEDQVSRAVEVTTFERLQTRERDAGFTERSLVARTPFFRSGRAGGWRDELSADQVARIERSHGTLMAEFGYLSHDGGDAARAYALRSLETPSSGSTSFAATDDDRRRPVLRRDTVLTKDPLIASTWMSDDLVLATSTGRLVSLDHMGAVVWQRMASATNLGVLVEALCAEFGIEDDTCLSDITPMIERLLANGAVTAE